MPHWLEHLLAPKSKELLKKQRWKILREGDTTASFAPDFFREVSDLRLPVPNSDLSALDADTRFEQSWQILSTHGSRESGSIKCVLRSTKHADSCEMVVLFPKANVAEPSSGTKSRARATVCVSSQIGCGVGCRFCATGTMGFRRNLDAWEILEQIHIARLIAHQEKRHLRNIVFMGMGEPLHNTNQVLESLKWITAEEGFGFSPRHVTVSTSGVPTAMQTLAKTYPQVRMALSLHSANETLRRSLMPRISNDLAGMKATVEAINRIQSPTPVWIEYILIGGVNDSESDALQLIEFCDSLTVEVNLIPYNPIHTTASPIGVGLNSLGLNSDGTNSGDGLTNVACWQQPAKETRLRFANQLRQAGIRTTIRQSFGQADNAACGQLVVLNAVSNRE